MTVNDPHPALAAKPAAKARHRLARAGAHARSRETRAHYAREGHAPPATGASGDHGRTRKLQCLASDRRTGANRRGGDQPHDKT